MNMLLRTINANEYKALYTHMKRDFKTGGLAPYFAIKRNLEAKIYDGFYIQGDGEHMETDIGYAIITAPAGMRLALINYFAILPEYRCRGYGGEFLHILPDRYPGRRFVLETEDLRYIKDAARQNVAARRVKFYERAGFVILPTARAKIFGADMLIMATGGDKLSAKAAINALYEPALNKVLRLSAIDVEDIETEAADEMV